MPSRIASMGTCRARRSGVLLRSGSAEHVALRRFLLPTNGSYYKLSGLQNMCRQSQATLAPHTFAQVFPAHEQLRDVHRLLTCPALMQ